MPDGIVKCPVEGVSPNALVIEALMSILGLVELLGITRSLLANPEFIGNYLEAYIWLGFVYWFTCTAMALISNQLERQFQPEKSGKVQS